MRPSPPPISHTVDLDDDDEDERTGAEHLLPPESGEPLSSPSLAVPPAPRAAPVAAPTEPAARRSATGDVWQQELAVLSRNARLLSERDTTRGALLFGAVSVLASTMTEVGAAHEALQAAARLSRERWISTLRRQRAWQARDFALALEAARDELEQVGEPRERVALLTEIAALEVAAHDDRLAARRALEEARELDPASPTVIEALSELHVVARDWEQLVAMVVAMANATVDVQYRSMMRHNAGVIQDVRLSRSAAARASYKLALTDNPSNIAAALSLETLCLLDEDWVELARTLLYQATLIGDPQTVRRLCERAGDLFWEKLHDAEPALAAYHQAARAAPTEWSPLRRLAAVLESTGRWRELVDIHEKELVVTHDPAARADLYYRIAETQRENLGHLDAAEVAYAAALDVDPLHLPTLHASDALFRGGQRWAELAQMQLREAEKIADPRRRADFLVEVAELIERRLGDRQEAIRLLERAYELVPDHRLAFFALDRLYRREEKWPELVRLYEQQAAHTDDRALYRFLRQEAGRLWSERVTNSTHAAAAFSDVLKVEEADIGPLFLLARVHEAAEEFDPLATVLEQQAAQLHDDIDRVGALHRLAAVLEVHLERPDDALAVHLRVLEIATEDEGSMRAVARLHHLAGRWAELIKIWTRQLAHCASESERAVLHYHIGRVHERQLGERDAAVAAYQRALADDPLHASALRALDRILRRDREWSELCEALQRRAAALSDPRQQALVWHEIAQIEELHLRDLEAAQRHYEAVLDRHAKYETAAIALVHVAQARGDWAGAAQRLEQLVDGTAHPEAKMALLAQLGLVYEHRTDEPERAAHCYAEAIEKSTIGRVFALAELRATEASSTDGAALISPLRRLGERCTDIRLAHGYRALAALRDEIASDDTRAELYIDASRLEQADPLVAQGVMRGLALVPRETPGSERTLAAALAAAAAVCSNAPVKILLLFEAALRLERAGLIEAATLYEQAAKSIADFLPVLRGQRRLASAVGDWTTAAALLAREAELAADRGDRIRALMTAGAITLEKLGDRAAGLRCYRRLLELEPSHEEAFVSARRLLEEQRDDAGLLELVVARAAATADVRERATILKLQAELHRDRFNDARSAVAALKQAIALDPDDLDSYLMLAPLEEEQRWWQGAADCHRKIAELTPGSDTSRTARLREAAIREDELGDREAARSILEELIVDVSDGQAARQLAQLCMRTGKYLRARELYLHAARTGTTPDRIGDFLAAAHVPIDSVADDAGWQATMQAFVLATAQRDGVPALVRYYEKLGDWNGFVRAGEHACQTVRGGDGMVALRVALASVYADRLSRPDLAAEQLQAARALAPSDSTLTQRLAQLQLANGQGDRAVGEFRRVLGNDPFNAPALRGLAESVRAQLPECAVMFAALADLGEGRGSAIAATPPRVPLAPGELDLLGARHPDFATLIEVMRQFEPFAPAIIADVLGRAPRGEAVPANHPMFLRCAQVAQIFGVAPLRLFIDPEVADVLLVADSGMALRIGQRFTAAPSLFLFEAARFLAFMVEQQTLAAVTDATAFMAILQALMPNQRAPEVERVKQRLGRVLPRKTRKELERLVGDGTVLHAALAYHDDVHRRADRAAVLVTRDPVSAIASLGGTSEIAGLRRKPRCHNLASWLLSDEAWTVITTFARRR